MSESRAYHAGVVQVSLNLAGEALTAALVAALSAEDHDSPVVQAILAAQKGLGDAQRAKIDWKEV